MQLRHSLRRFGFKVYDNDAFLVTRIYSVDNMVVSEWWWIEKDLVGSFHGLIFDTIPEFAGNNWEKPLKPQSWEPVAGAEI
jgi:hypothetical protein